MEKFLHQEQHRETKFEKTTYETLQLNSGRFWHIYGRQDRKASTNNIQSNHPQNLNKCFGNSKQEHNYGESNH
jgi:hypothetical protein